MLRTFVLVAAMLAFSAAVLGVIAEPAAWPMLLGSAVFLAGTLFERTRYGAAQPRPDGDGWRATGERFVDDASGRVVGVWFNARTGERRYVDIAENP